MATEEVRNLDWIAELERLEKEATPGPWKMCGASDGACQCGLIWSLPRDTTVATAETNAGSEVAEIPHAERCANGNLIAAMRNAATSLLASARRAAVLEAFLAEHGEAVEGGLRGIYDEFELRDELEAFRKLRGKR